MKKKVLVFFLVLVMVMSVACSKSEEQKNAPTNAPTQTAADDSASKDTSAQTATPTAVPVNDQSDASSETASEDTGKDSASASEGTAADKADSNGIYDENGEMYVEYTEDFYYKNVLLGSIPYDLDAYAPIALLVGRWFNYTGEAHVTTGYFFYSDGFVSKVYGNGTVSPVVTDFTLKDDSSIYIDLWDTELKLADGHLVDSDGYTMPFDYAEFPMTDVMCCEFGGYLSREKDLKDSLPAEYFLLSADEPVFTYVSPDNTFSGRIQIESPQVFTLISDDGEYSETFSMDYTYHFLSACDEEWFLYKDGIDDSSSEDYFADETASNGEVVISWKPVNNDEACDIIINVYDTNGNVIYPQYESFEEYSYSVSSDSVPALIEIMGDAPSFESTQLLANNDFTVSLIKSAGSGADNREIYTIDRDSLYADCYIKADTGIHYFSIPVDWDALNVAGLASN